MRKLQKILANAMDDKDSLFKYRQRIMYLFGIAVFVMVTPFVIDNLIEGNYLLAASIALLVLILSGNSLAYKLNMKLRGVTPAFFVSLMLVTLISTAQRGIYGVFWAFPAILFISFAMSHKAARIYSAIYFFYNAAVMFFYLPAPLAARALMGLAITILFTNIFLNIIYHLREQLLEQSTSDPLTGALNRRLLDELLEGAIDRKQRLAEPSSMLMIDIDRFKAINDEFGHDAGDEVIKGIVDLINQRSRKIDRLFRIGGEEFMLLLPVAELENAEKVAEYMRQLVEDAELIKGKKVTVSIGACELQFGDTAAEWTKRADRALYTAKQTGRNRVKLCDFKRQAEMSAG